jgi:hypothetical protein
VSDTRLDAAARERIAGALLRAATAAPLRDVPQAELLLPLDGPRVVEATGADGRVLGFALVGATLFELHDGDGLLAFLREGARGLDPLALVLLVCRYRLPVLVDAEPIELAGLAVDGTAITFAAGSGRWRLVTGSGAALERMDA